jgi:hypothetical protein
LVPGSATFSVTGSHFTSVHSITSGNPARWSGTDFDAFPDQYAVAQIITINATGSLDVMLGVICRASGDVDGNRDYYFYRVMETAGTSGSASRTTQLGHCKNGVESVQVTGAIVWAPNDTVELECIGNPPTLTGFKNSVLTGQSYVDSVSPLTTGRPGVMTNISQIGDNFVGGSAAADPPLPSGKNIQRIIRPRIFAPGLAR